MMSPEMLLGTGFLQKRFVTRSHTVVLAVVEWTPVECGNIEIMRVNDMEVSFGKAQDPVGMMATAMKIDCWDHICISKPRPLA